MAENGAVASRPAADGSSPPVDLQDVSVVFPTPSGEKNPALRDIDLRVDGAEIVCLLGPSGCGKSTILNVVAGLVRPAGGSARCYGRPIEGVNTEVGYITQSPNLLPWRSLRDNIRIGLEIDKLDRREQDRRIEAVVDLLGLTGYEDLYPRQLSGGMRSRVSLARTLVTDRSILLMDEPFSALDALRRTQLQTEVQRIWLQDQTTILFVTHDIDEALILGGRILVLSPGPNSRVVGEYRIDLEYPRDVAAVRNHPEYGDLWGRLWADLGGGDDGHD